MSKDIRARHPSQFLLPVGLLVILAFILARYWLLHSPSPREFAMYQARYRGIVAKIKQLGLAVRDKPYYFYVESSFDPSSLNARGSVFNEGGSGLAGRITVLHREDGRYQMTLVTDDEGHAGAYGYVYSEVPLEAGMGDSHPYDLGNDLPFLRQKLAPDWWIGYNDTF